ncbi:MAG: hypothetical protein AAFP19_20790 [Bacteroidota bacterium]
MMKNRQIRAFLFTFSLISFLGNSSLFADTRSSTLFNLMSYQEVLEMSLEFDLDALIGNRRNEGSEKGLLTFKDANGKKQEWLTKVSLRGKFRRMRCEEMPPLKLKFKKDHLLANDLLPFNDMKLVTPCVSDKQTAKELIVKEYLAYKLYNELSNASYRVQLVRITYKDSKSRKKSKHWGFIIEDTAELRSRLNADKCESCFGLPIEQFSQDQLKVIQIFQYMIGNADWNVKIGRNIKRVITGKQQYQAIPYDFDSSGLVDAPYALPNPDYGLTYIGERYEGYLEGILPTDEVFQLFRDKQDRFLQIVRDSKQLHYEAKKKTIAYINSFYEQINQDSKPQDGELMGD